MRNLNRQFANFIHSQLRLQRALAGAPAPARVQGNLEEITRFGSNPGNLGMWTYVPPRLALTPALLVVLHGGAQTVHGYDQGAGWSTLAKRHGFAVLYAEQKLSNSLLRCLSWFEAEDAERDRGEALSIRQMVRYMVSRHRLSEDRVFITGFSSGGAMASVMLATYPDVFAGGAILAGVPYGAATNAYEVFESMVHPRPRKANEWGDLVRRASRHKGPWPRISIWHGSRDVTINPVNAIELAKQWTNVHALPSAPMVEDVVDGHPRQAWIDTSGEVVLETNIIEPLAHGIPVSPGRGKGCCGAAGPFFPNIGISSSHRIAEFWGLTTTRARPATAA